jgi:hypothetical protein
MNGEKSSQSWGKTHAFHDRRILNPRPHSRNRSVGKGWEQPSFEIAVWASHLPFFQFDSYLMLASFKTRGLGRGCNRQGHHRELPSLQTQGSSEAGR